MKETDIILVAGFGTALIWSCLFGLTEGKTRSFVTWVGVFINIMLLAISQNFMLLLAGVASGVILGSVKEGFNYLFRKIGIHDRHVMQGWKNWVVLSVIMFTMFYLTIAIIIMKQ